MIPFRDRAKDALPTILLTLASIIQALALELFWTRASDEAPYLWHFGPFFWVGWAQCAAVFVGILVIWVYYASLVMRFRWVPQVRDSVIPFIFGISEFALAETMGPDFLSVWFLLFAFVFGFASWSSHTTFARAALEPENAPYFDRLNRSRLAQHGPQLLPTAMLCVCAWLVWGADPAGGLVLGCMLAAAIFVLIQLWLQGVYWNRTLAFDQQPSDEQPPADDA